MKKNTHKITEILPLNQNIKPVHAQSGFSLIEIMVAAVILSIGILGVVGLQIVGLKGTHQSYMKQQAMAIVQSVTERMHSNKQGVIAGDYEDSSVGFDCSALAESCDAAGSNCLVADIAKVDLHNIMCGYKKGSAPRTSGVKAVAAGDISSFMNGELDITCPTGCASGEVRIEVKWTESEIGSENPGPKDSLVVNTRILR